MELLRISDRDRKILREQVSDKIEALLPITRMGIEWRPTFEKAARDWRIKANGVPANDPARDEYLANAIAHDFVLLEDGKEI